VEETMKKLKIYLDTSIINFLFADDAKDYKMVTEEFFNRYLDKYEVFISEIVYLEINRTRDQSRKRQLLDAIEKFQLEVYDSLNEEIESLANTYIINNIIPQNKTEDALHVAFCVFYDFDVLLSWNFKHLANIRKQAQINSLNKTLGYFKELNLLNPMEVFFDD
jgi:predicted nucleic acid-binding protein